MKDTWQVNGSWLDSGKADVLRVDAASAADAIGLAAALRFSVTGCGPAGPLSPQAPPPAKKPRPPYAGRKSPVKKPKPVPIPLPAPDTDGLTAIKGLVLRHPHWLDVATGEKPIEYRSWPVPGNYRGPLAICAAKEKVAGAVAGCALCVVDLVDCVCAGFKDYEWVLENPRIIDPVPIAGRLGSMDLKIRLDFDVEWEVVE